MQVVVTDSGYPSLSSTAHVVVEVLDVNDKKPEFLEKFYRSRVMAVTEDKGKTPLLRVTARDEDIGQNAQITYKLKGKKQIFGIDADTGMIYAKGLISVGSYALKVKKYIFILRNNTFTLLYTNALAQQILVHVYIKFK